MKGESNMFLRKVLGRAVAATATTGLLVAPLALTTSPAFTNVACTDDPNESTTTLTLAKDVAQYGTKNQVTATVTPKPTNPDTHVEFSVEGSESGYGFSQRVGRNASVERLLPRGLAAGDTYQVRARYDGCAWSEPVSYEVTQATSKPAPSVLNARRAKFRTTVVGGGGLDPKAGKVDFLVRRAGGDVMRTETGYLSGGVETVNLPNLKKGRYVLEVTYAGNKNFAAGTGKQSFRVR
jgi:hypothetical protein